MSFWPECCSYHSKDKPTNHTCPYCTWHHPPSHLPLCRRQTHQSYMSLLYMAPPTFTSPSLQKTNPPIIHVLTVYSTTHLHISLFAEGHDFGRKPNLVGSAKHYHSENTHSTWYTVSCRLKIQNIYIVLSVLVSDFIMNIKGIRTIFMHKYLCMCDMSISCHSRHSIVRMPHKSNGATKMAK